MVLYRIIALIKKDLMWCFGNRRILTTLLIGPVFSGLVLCIPVMTRFLPELTDQSAGVTSEFSFFAVVFVAYMSGMSFTFSLIIQEKTKGTLLALLSTPLKPLEFAIGKLFLAFITSLLFAVIFISVDIFLNPQTMFSLNLLAFFNLILFTATICLLGCLLGIFTETELESGKVLIIPSMLIVGSAALLTNQQLETLYPAMQNINFFNPLFHIFEVLKYPGWRQSLFHTGFNLLFFMVFLFFTGFYVKFYFSNNREKRFSHKLFTGLICLIGIYTVSGLLSSKVINMLKAENFSLVKLKEYAEKFTPEQKLIPLKDFFKNSQIAGIKISPNGKYLAYLKSYQSRMNIYVRPVDNSTPEKRITSQTTRDIRTFGWKENDTLIFLRDTGGDENFHLFRVFATGEGEQNLTSFKETKVNLIDFLDEISEDYVLIETNQRKKTVFDAYRLNIKTGDLKMAAENPGHFTGWMTDHEGKLRVALSVDGVNDSVYYRDTEEEEFQKIITTDFRDSFVPVLFTFDNRRLYALSNIKRDKKAVELFDPKQKKVLSTLFAHPEVDVSALAYSKKRKVPVSVTYSTWKAQYHFLDSKMKQIFQDLQSKIPKKEISIHSMDREENLMVVLAYSDRSPGIYYLYNVADKILKQIANPRPWIKEEAMAEVKPIRYTSRDDLVIHGYLTLPKRSNGKNIPVVVKPHGGPWTRDGYGYNSESQFLASRGYAVLQINFRGSTGYGKKFWMAGFKEWGKKMQNDITDGVRYLIGQGIADKDKVAIYGGSYGGYAVLAGLTFTPDLYACGVDYVGVSNIFTLLKTIPPYWEQGRKQLYEMIGDPEKDKQLLRAASPVFHADKIKAPLFVVQGANDPRVKKAESDQIVKALESRGVEVPYLVKYNEGHGFLNEENRMEFYFLMEAFLRKCLQ